MSANPMGPMPGDGGDPGDENDSQGLAECKQKISALDARVTALEQKAGIGGNGNENPSINKAPSLIANNKQPGGHGKLPFFGG